MAVDQGICVREEEGLEVPSRFLLVRSACDAVAT